MGRFVGSFMDDRELDRPDLNKCPDCECYFPQDNCPICGKECPPEMRAGNRKRQKHKKPRNGKSKNVTFVDWYHRWWFIILMLLFMPLIGIILLIGSPHKKTVKYTVLAIAVIYVILQYFGFGRIYGSVFSLFDKPVDTSLSYEEYVDKCTSISAEELFRDPDKFEDEFVTLELTVVNSVIDSEGYYNNEKYSEYYVCAFTNENGSTFDFLIRNCIISGKKNYVRGDVIRLYGEVEGDEDFYGTDGVFYDNVCVNMAYAELVK